MEKVRKRFHFYGRVQGVGFRYHAYYSASGLGLSGWVKNCYNGSVEAEVQGYPEEIREFLHQLQNARYIVIEDYDVKQIPLETEIGFTIRH